MPDPRMGYGAVSYIKRRTRQDRPRVDRIALLALLLELPGADHGLVLLNERAAARQLGCHRATVARMLDELEKAGFIRREQHMLPCCFRRG